MTLSQAIFLLECVYCKFRVVNIFSVKEHYFIMEMVVWILFLSKYINKIIVKMFIEDLVFDLSFTILYVNDVYEICIEYSKCIYTIYIYSILYYILISVNENKSFVILHLKYINFGLTFYWFDIYQRRKCKELYSFYILFYYLLQCKLKLVTTLMVLLVYISVNYIYS